MYDCPQHTGNTVFPFGVIICNCFSYLLLLQQTTPELNDLKWQVITFYDPVDSIPWYWLGLWDNWKDQNDLILNSWSLTPAGIIESLMPAGPQEHRPRAQREPGRQWVKDWQRARKMEVSEYGVVTIPWWLRQVTNFIKTWQVNADTTFQHNGSQATFIWLAVA